MPEHDSGGHRQDPDVDLGPGHWTRLPRVEFDALPPGTPYVIPLSGDHVDAWIPDADADEPA